MKTIAAIFILATIAFSNIMVVAGENKTGKNLLAGSANQKVFANNLVSSNTGINSADRLIVREAEQDFETYFDEKRLAEEELAKSQFIETAELLTAEGSDKEIEKYTEKLLSLELAKSKK
jgi:hypothetical protein